MTQDKDTTARRRGRSSVRGRRTRAGSLGIAVVAFGFLATGSLYLTTQVRANTVATNLTEWAELGHVPDGSAWDHLWDIASAPGTARFRAAGAAEHLALLSEWRAHQLRLDNQQRATWYAQSAHHYADALAARPLSAEYWAQYAYSGLGELSRVDRLGAVDRALELGHGRRGIQQRALMALLADVDLDVARIGERVELLIQQGSNPGKALNELEQASDALGFEDPRVQRVRKAVDGTSGTGLAVGDEG